MMNLEEYKAILESSPNMIWRSNLTKECDYFNKTWLDFTGRTFEQEYGYGWAEGVHPDDFDRCVEIYTTNFDIQQPFEMDYRLKRADGQYRWINDRGTPFYDNQQNFIGYIGSCMDITEKIEGKQLIEMAQTDVLCKTYNRQYSLQLLEDLFKASKENNTKISLLMMDIDDFKQINDKYGHLAGDKVLSNIGQLVKREIRSNDIIGRYGGDEFIIGLSDPNPKTAQATAERISKTIASSKIPLSNDKTLSFTVSIGGATLKDETTLDQFINNADKKLYQAKRNGKNLVKF
ncbi:MAG: hypothetical protein FD141_789 [Fusobacteria bacterium]|nr:MAG: hypothetical protein FD141_789 [Fusobacteriota bacterium]KAF0228545.1 MAG: hypothetical protein FD182_801 [Fusobacteriota bacterium]